jgi:hypothetical protein
MEAFFIPDGRALVPSPMARGPWAPDMLHGRLLAGLLARTIERDHGDPEFQPGRVTVDLFRSPPMRPLEISTSVVRAGKRIRVIDGAVTIDGDVYARASIVMLRRAEQPSGDVWSPASWDAPHPDTLPGPAWDAPWEMRPISGGGFDSSDQKSMWLREIRELVDGEAWTPLARVATAADIANPLANSGSNGLEFINGDITLYLARLPVDEWVGFEVAQHISADGVAVGECVVYDTQGPIGTSTVSAVAQRTMNTSR